MSCWRRALPWLLLALLGCQRPTPPSVDPALRCPEETLGLPIDPPLLAFLSRARSAHHLADGQLEAEDSQQATQVLEALLSGPLPAGSEARAEVREVLSDTHARLADLLSRAGDFDGALRHVERGLALVPETTYYRGQLLEQRGHVEERRAAALADAGDTAGAAAARQRALQAFAQAMDLQAKVIECSLRASPR